jgi:hypothetical protein
MTETLFVTALYDLARFESNHERENDQKYFDLCTFTMRQSPLIIFAEPDLLERVKAARRQYNNGDDGTKITYITRRLQDLRYFTDDTVQSVKEIWKIHPFVTNSPNKVTAAYVALMWNKFEFIREAAHLCPEYSSYTWIDFGIRKALPVEMHEVRVQDFMSPLTIASNKFGVTVINPLVQEEYQDPEKWCTRWNYRVCGNFWTVGVELLDKWYRYITGEITEYLKRGYAAPDEEYLARFTFANATDCTFFFGDYGSSISNRSVFKHDVTVAKHAIERAHVHSLHNMAIAGYSALLNAVCRKNSITADINDVYKWLLNLFIHMCYVDRAEALRIANMLIYVRDRHVYLRQAMTSSKDYIKYLFSFVGIRYDAVNTTVTSVNDDGIVAWILKTDKSG